MATRSQAINVVGAGAVGMLSALALHRRGWKVRLFDRGSVGRESSWAGGGVLSPILPWDYPQAIWRLSRRSLDLYPAIAADLSESTGVDPELGFSGAFALDVDTHGTGLAWCRDAGLPASVIEMALPGSAAPRAALALPWVGQIRNPRLCRALALRLRQLGVEIHEHEPVIEWRQSGDRIIGLHTDGGIFDADACVLAAGAWSGTLTDLPVTPVRGQMLLIAAAPGLLPGIVFDRGRYLIPRRDGRILVGSTVEPVGFDKRVTAEAREQLLIFARGVLGQAASRIEAHWSGLRPGSADGLPYIGEHPRHAGLFVNTGHYRNGLVMAPASAELLADVIEGRAPQVDASDYAVTPDRLRPTG